MPRCPARIGLAILAAALGLVLAWGPAPAADKAPVVVGAVLPMTGAVAAYGQMAWNGVKLAHQMRPTVNGRPVKLVLADNKSDNVEAANAASRLIKKEGALAILGPATSGRALAVVPLCEAAKRPMISPSATNPLVTQGKRYAFRVCFIDPFQGAKAAEFAYQTLGARKAALIIDVAQDYCVGLGGFFMKAFKKLGGKVVAVTKCATGDQDFSAQLGTVMSSGADLLYLPNYYTEDALVARQAKELGLELPILSGDGAHAPELIKIGGRSVEGLMFTALFNPVKPANPTAAKFFELYARARQKGELGEDMTAFHALGADTYLVLLNAVKRSRTSNGPNVRAALAATKDFPGVSGTINIGPDGNAVKSVTVLKVQDGRFAYVTTMNP
ncbi:MAG: ABC transporter substrate-binding protein [Desulfarculaceae bacterium]|nr:ABC transporter substrate-binding protein [Desulfarculaceae bacterium]MCF8073886.1 ABC transporter substrate-binding protein [Desulfarculaceae bacterium]MCF8102866.1 ABC transporter substrate-binding protein [Desulfarculaceae bacterium]MCF8116310.1 ABC transporter substrate-binding protein [Desulfarculaceae bacterium]